MAAASGALFTAAHQHLITCKRKKDRERERKKEGRAGQGGRQIGIDRAAAARHLIRVNAIVC